MREDFLQRLLIFFCGYALMYQCIKEAYVAVKESDVMLV